jgi:aspartyl-tRNA synthetase
MVDYIRTHYCHELRKENISETVNLSGWVNRRRDHGGLIFIDLRDRFGLTQLVFDPKVNEEAHQLADSLRSEWVITIKGKVIPRSEGMANPNLVTGDIEIEVITLNVLSKAKTPPFSVCDDLIEANEELRLKYRYLDLRRGDISKNLILRHKISQATRNFLDQESFIEITTPILGKSTPEGARDYLVPSRVHPGNFYALPQSPQLFKQLCMVGGMDRYYQIATCFRDEDLRANRQPEFAQIDIEASFLKPSLFFPIIEKMLQTIFKKVGVGELSSPFESMTYKECLNKYGTDKPDLRFAMPLFNASSIASESNFTVFKKVIEDEGVVKGLCVKGGANISRKQIDAYTAFIAKLGVNGLAWMKVQENKLHSNIVKFFSEEQQQDLLALTGAQNDDIIFMVAEKEKKANQALDHLRRKLAQDRQLIKKDDYKFLWVIDFPLFNYDEETKQLHSEHHPFTSPFEDDIHLMDTEPLKVRSSSYDLVLNGHELASGSQRIHDPDLQKKVFEALKISAEDIENRFGFFVNSLAFGTPPHLGIALGLDRLCMVLCHTENIRDVIAFPKTQKASDLMNESPALISDEQLKELKIITEE